jgi:hypothetical protein
MERVTGIEPALSAWEADVLPLNYTRAVPVGPAAETSIADERGRPHGGFGAAVGGEGTDGADRPSGAVRRDAVGRRLSGGMVVAGSGGCGGRRCRMHRKEVRGRFAIWVLGQFSTKGVLRTGQVRDLLAD